MMAEGLPNDSSTSRVGAVIVLIMAVFAAGFFFGRFWGNQISDTVHYDLKSLPATSEFRLNDTVAAVDINKEAGQTIFEVILPDGVLLPSGSHMEGFLVSETQGREVYLPVGSIDRIRQGKRYGRQTNFGYNLESYKKAIVSLQFDNRVTPQTIILEGDIN